MREKREREKGEGERERELNRIAQRIQRDIIIEVS